MDGGGGGGCSIGSNNPLLALAPAPAFFQFSALGDRTRRAASHLPCAEKGSSKAGRGRRRGAARLRFDERVQAKERSAIANDDDSRAALGVFTFSLSRARALSLSARAIRCDRTTERERRSERGKQESWRSTQGLRTLNFGGKRKRKIEE